MDLVLFEDSIEYDVWVRLALVFPIILLIALGILFYIDAHYSDVIPSESETESNFGAISSLSPLILAIKKWNRLVFPLLFHG